MNLPKKRFNGNGQDKQDLQDLGSLEFKDLKF